MIAHAATFFVFALWKRQASRQHAHNECSVTNEAGAAIPPNSLQPTETRARIATPDKCIHIHKLSTHFYGVPPLCDVGFSYFFWWLMNRSESAAKMR